MAGTSTREYFDSLFGGDLLEEEGSDGGGKVGSEEGEKGGKGGPADVRARMDRPGKTAENPIGASVENAEQTNGLRAKTGDRPNQVGVSPIGQSSNVGHSSAEQKPDGIVRPLSSKTAHKVVERLHEFGLAAFWLKSPTQGYLFDQGKRIEVPPKGRGKSPALRNWSEGPAASMEELHRQYGDIERGWNVGIRTGWVEGARKKIIGVDIDSRAAFEWATAHLPETRVRVMTSESPGQHWYYECKGPGIPNRVKVRVDGGRISLDVRGDGGILVAPGSIHGTGYQYRTDPKWTQEAFDSMPAFSPAWFEWKGEAPRVYDPSEAPPELKPPVELSIDRIFKRARAYVEGTPGSISGRGTASSECFFLARALVRGFCIQPEDAAKLMHGSAWNSRCQDDQLRPYPWSLDELRHKCLDAARLPFEKPVGWLLLAETPNGNVSAPAAEAEVPEDGKGSHLEELYKRAREVEEESKSWDATLEEERIENPHMRGWPLTDTGNAERLVARYGKVIAWVGDQSTWRVYDSETGLWLQREVALERAAKATARAIGEEIAWSEVSLEKLESQVAALKVAGHLTPEMEKIHERKEKSHKALLAHQRRAESADGRAAMIRLARSEKGVAKSAAAFDRHPFLLGVKNGVVDLQAEGGPRLLAHSPRWGITKSCLVPWRPEAQADLWRRCLVEWTGGDAELEAYLQRLAGYILTGSMEEQVVTFFWGHGLNGKSTFCNAIFAVLGPYAAAAPAGFLAEMKNVDEANPSRLSGLAALEGVRFVLATETRDSMFVDEAMIKRLRSSEPIKVKLMRQDQRDITPVWKIVQTLNPKPIIRATDWGTWRSVNLVPWAHEIPPERIDRRLEHKLAQEREGILAWMVEGCRLWQQRGLDPPEKLRAGLAAYRRTQDSLRRFVDDHFVITGKEGDGVPSQVFRQMYGRYCEEEGLKPQSGPALERRMGEWGVSLKERIWRGLRVK